MNEMERYLEEHNYISRNKNKDPLRQQELSKKRAECISNKYNNLVEEKDKEIERLSTELNTCMIERNQFLSEIERLNNIIDLKSFFIQDLLELISYSNDNDLHTKVHLTGIEYQEKLKELKEGK